MFFGVSMSGLIIIYGAQCEVGAPCPHYMFSFNPNIKALYSWIWFDQEAQMVNWAAFVSHF